MMNVGKYIFWIASIILICNAFASFVANDYNFNALFVMLCFSVPMLTVAFINWRFKWLYDENPVER